MSVSRYVILEKAVGETPLSAAEAWRATQSPAYQGLPLAYAGRLDPMASGKLLVLIGDECKVQERYHALDKAYDFSVLLGIGSDTDDVLGRLSPDPHVPPVPDTVILENILKRYRGQITLPYPHFSAKTVAGKPLHVWTLENRLSEITIPTITNTVYQLKNTRIEAKSRQTIYTEVVEKISLLPHVTDPRKALGADFRRVDVLADWAAWASVGSPQDQFTIIHVLCIASSGTYMRSLAAAIGRDLGTSGLAYHIHRTTIGRFQSLPLLGGWWWRKLR